MPLGHVEFCLFLCGCCPACPQRRAREPFILLERDETCDSEEFFCADVLVSVPLHTREEGVEL